MTRCAASPAGPTHPGPAFPDADRTDGYRGNGSTLLLRLPAVIDSNTASQLRRLLTLPLDGYRELVLDCSDVELMKSCTVTLLVALRRRCASRGVELKLSRMSPATREFLFMTGLHRIISAHDPRQAVRQIRSAGNPQAA